MGIIWNPACLLPNELPFAFSTLICSLYFALLNIISTFFCLEAKPKKKNKTKKISVAHPEIFGTSAVTFFFFYENPSKVKRFQ